MSEKRWTYGDNGSHWEGCAEVHWDCKIAQLEAENARLKAVISKTQNRDCFMCKYLDSYNMKCTIPVATCVNYALWEGKD